MKIEVWGGHVPDQQSTIEAKMSQISRKMLAQISGTIAS